MVLSIWKGGVYVNIKAKNHENIYVVAIWSLLYGNYPQGTGQDVNAKKLGLSDHRTSTGMKQGPAR